MKSYIIPAGAALLAVLLIFVLMAGQGGASAETMPRSISVVGASEIKVVPDQAIISVTVYTESNNLAEAKQANDEKVKHLQALSAEAGIAKEQIKTLYSNIQPKYRYDNATSKQLFDGYMVSNSVELTLDKLDAAGDFIGKLVQAGFDRLDSVNYTLKDEKQVRQNARMAAVSNARDKAAQMAAQLDEEIGKPLLIVEQGAEASQQPHPMMMKSRMAMAADSSAPETTPGLMTIEERVTVSFELE